GHPRVQVEDARRVAGVEVDVGQLAAERARDAVQERALVLQVDAVGEETREVRGREPGHGERGEASHARPAARPGAAPAPRAASRTADTSAAAVSQSKRAAQRAAPAARRPRSAASPSTRPSARASAAASPGGTRTPVWPARTAPSPALVTGLARRTPGSAAIASTTRSVRLYGSTRPSTSTVGSSARGPGPGR